MCRASDRANLVAWLAAEAGRIEAAGRIPEDVVGRLADTRLFAMSQPRASGGDELSLRETYQRVMDVARGCASCAWVVGLGAANVLTAAKFSGAAQREVFAAGQTPIISVLTAGAIRAAQAQRTSDGIRLSGTWRYASGIDVARWVGLIVEVPAANGGAGEAHMALVPQPEFRIDHGSWNVLGMRGTGSKDVSLDGAYVPEHRLMRWSDLQAGARHPECPNDGPLYKASLTPTNALSVLAPTLGVASAVVEEFCVLARERTGAGRATAMRDDKIILVEAASAEATMAILRVAMLAEAAEVEARAHGGRQLSLEERAALRMRFAVIARQALATAQRLFALLGGSLLPAGTRIERQFRDLHAMSSHFLLQPEPIGEAYGRTLLGLGLPPGTRL